MDCTLSLPTTSRQEPYRSDNIFESLLEQYKAAISGPCQLPRVAALLEKEIDALGIVPQRYDFLGRPHQQRLSEYFRTKPLRFVRPLADVNDRNATRKWSSSQFASRKNGRRSVSRMSLLCLRELGVDVPFPRFQPVELFEQSLERHSRVAGHIDKAYTVHFDKTSRYALTAADDCVIKLWDVNTAMLRFTFRGHLGLISDMAVSHCNQLMASVGNDKTVRVWSLRSGANIEVFRKHTAQVTGVTFLPYVYGSKRYLVSYGYDCNVVFYEFDEKTAEFTRPPLVFHTRDATGMKCVACTHSPSGQWVAVGDTQGYARIFRLENDVITQHESLRVLPHCERVDSLVWNHSGFSFVAASGKLLTGRIWRLNGGVWRYLEFQPPNPDADIMALFAQPKMKYAVSQVCWTLDDLYIIASGTDHKIRVYDSTTGEQKQCLSGHKREAYHLRTHPFLRNIILSGAHDGLLLIWDIDTGRLLRKFTNETSERDATAGVLDLQITPDGTRIATVDTLGRLIIYGLGSNDTVGVPREQFFLSDYEALDVDPNGFALDASTGLATHLLHPPVLVDIDRSFYDDQWQRLVPGKEIDLNSTTCAWLSRNMVPMLTAAQVKNWAEEMTAIEELENSVFYDCMSRTDRRYLLFREASLPPGAANSGVPRPAPRARQRNAVPTVEDEIAAQQARRVAIEMDGYRSEDDQSYSGSSASGDDSGQEEANSDSDYSEGTARSRRARDIENAEEAPPAEVVTTSFGRRVQRRVLDAESSASERGHVSQSQRQRRRNPERTDSAFTADDASQGEDDLQGPSNSAVVRTELQPRKPRTKRIGIFETFPDNMRSTVRRRFPYFAQLGDRVVYCKQGHQRYLDSVAEQNLYPITGKMRPRESLKAEECCIVEEVKYTRKPYRLTVIRLAQLNNRNEKTDVSFSVRMHDLVNCPDFLVLRQHYDLSIQQNLRDGDKMEAILDKKWWAGTITSKDAKDEAYPDSHWFCLNIRWDNGEEDIVSPWDCQPFLNRRSITDATEEDEAKWGDYNPSEEEWSGSGSPMGNRDACCTRMIQGIAQLTHLESVVAFANPVSLSEFPHYAGIVDYPIDLDTISQRLTERFYRRQKALEQDIRFIAVAAEQFNEPISAIVDQARRLVETLIRFCRSPEICAGDIHDLHEEIWQLPPEEIVEFRKRQRPQIDMEVVQLAAQMAQDAPGSPPEAGWRKETRAALEALMGIQPAKHFLRVADMSQDLVDAYGDVTEIGDLESILSDLPHALSPMEVRESVENLMLDIRNHLDRHTSREYDCTFQVVDLFERKMSSIVTGFQEAFSSLSQFEVIERPRRRSCREDSRGRARHYNTRSVHTNGRPSRNLPGYYRQLANGSSQLDVNGTGTMSAPRSTQRRTQRMRSETEVVDGSDFGSDLLSGLSDGDDMAQPGTDAEAPSSSRPVEDSSSDSRSRRARKKQILDSDPPSSEDDYPPPRRNGGQVQLEIQSLSTVDPSETTSMHSRLRRPRVRSPHDEASSSESLNQNGRSAVRSGNSRSKRLRMDSSDEEPSMRPSQRGHPRTTSTRSSRRRAVDYAEDSGADDMEEQRETVSQRGRVRRVRRLS